MNLVDLDANAADCLIEHPLLLPLFKELGIDYCCGGKSLEVACLERGLVPHVVQSRCQELLYARGDGAGRDSGSGSPL
ncbi:MAG: DUF542 domain-containing protein [Planctomycetes bacterium]|nr:DUF542 domain-containing protein [Planctomycetota bacterium]